MTASTLTSWARVVRRVLFEAGCDAEALFRAAGLDPAALDDPQGRYPLDRTARLWALAVQATGDPALGLTVARRAAPTSFHALGYAVLASPSVLDALQRCERYLAVVSDAARLQLRRESDQHLWLHIVAPDHGPAPVAEAVDAIAAVMVQLVRSRLGRETHPLAVRLRRPAPADPAPWQRLFRAPLQFGAADDALCWPLAPLIQPLDSGNPALAEANEALARQALAERGGSGLGERLRALLRERLPRGEPGEDALAEALHLSRRSLQRKLAAEGLSYAGLLREVREAEARRHLAGAEHSVSEIAYLLGFADASAFSRAFKRWTGQSPAQLRAAAGAATLTVPAAGE